MLWRWLPWQYFVRRAARAHGFLDPITLMARLQRFAQPSEVSEPIELLRAGVVFHARGLINSRVIQHNRDWVWPYWVERQFDPRDVSFVPRAFSITHVNLSHRNWTAVGQPENNELPIVDPRGLLTPFFDGWSLDAWVIGAGGTKLLPSRSLTAEQDVDLGDGVAVRTITQDKGLSLRNRIEVVEEGGRQICRMSIQGLSDDGGWLCLALRPYNPEGVALLHRARISSDKRHWLVDGDKRIDFSAPADRHHAATYADGDVLMRLEDARDEVEGHCEVGMLTAAAMFKLELGRSRQLDVRIPLPDAPASPSWETTLSQSCRLSIPDPQMQMLWDSAIRTLVLHSSEDVYPGPYTYKRFWYRDAAFILHALLCAGFADRVERAVDRFPTRQKANGYFHSQDGEWDSNGEALWTMERFARFTASPPKLDWWQAASKGARWIGRKRTKSSGNEAHAGLLPAGFSAEHLGPNDYYYWDDFWGLAGLQAASGLAEMVGDDQAKSEFSCEAGAFSRAIDRSLSTLPPRLGRPAIAAAPNRRLDAGAIGSLAISYPLKLSEANDPRPFDTAEYLMESTFLDGGFFQDMIHSGINAYLTLHVAQVLLRAGDARYWELMRSVARLATSTGQWPEAIHPHTLGGCMGDGQHVWAAAEWVLMQRNCFVREEKDTLILASGIPDVWLRSGQPLSFGPAPTEFGPISVQIQKSSKGIEIRWQANWYRQPPQVEIRLPGQDAVSLPPEAKEWVFEEVAAE